MLTIQTILLFLSSASRSYMDWSPSRSIGRCAHTKRVKNKEYLKVMWNALYAKRKNFDLAGALDLT